MNKNISILMLFDCVRVNTGLGFHRICNSEKKGGYMWIDGLTSYYIEGDHIWSSWVRGICLPCVILRREGRHDHIWISNFLWRQFRGVGLCPYMAYGWRLPIYGSALAPWVFGGTKKPHTLLLTRHETSISGLA